MHKKRAREVCSVVLGVNLLMLAGCGSGALRQARLMQQRDADTTQMQGPLAVGASIVPKIDFSLPGSGGLPVQLMTSRPDVLSAQGHLLTGQAAGVSAVLIRAEDGTVVDFIHLWVAEPSHIALEMLGDDRRRQGELSDTIELTVGEDVRIRPVLYAGNQELSGRAETVWTIDEQVADILRDGEPTRRRLIARAPGRTTVRVAALGCESTFDLMVVPK